nr:Fe-S cluster assembly protein SufD [Paracoccaceae bacterium]
RRHEYWRYTPVRDLTPETGVTARAGASDPFAGLDAYRLVFVDGRLDLARSDRDALAAAADVANAEGAPWMNKVFHQLQGHPNPGAKFQVERPIADLNLAMFTDGLAVRIPAGVTLEKPIHLRYEGAAGAHLRLEMLVEQGANVVVLESGAGALTTGAEIVVEKDAVMRHLRAQTESGGQQFTAMFAKVAEGGTFSGFTLSADGALIRNEVVLELAGESAAGHVAGGVMAQGKSHVDNTVYVTHGAVGGESRQVYKHVLDDDSRGVFQGKILVRQPAQKTDGYQISQSVLLSETAEFDAKPELEIYADDVKCSHGSTTGALDETAMFYLRSRGVQRPEAEAMLVAAFVEEAIEEIADEAHQEVMRAEVGAWMARRRG